MTRKFGLFVGSILTALSAVGFMSGIILLVVAHEMPAHSDEARATELTIQYEHRYTNGTPEEKKSIEQQIVSLRTSKWRFFDTGLAMCLIGLILLVAIIRFKLWDVRMFRFATTPRTRLGLLVLASGAWLTLLPASFLELENEYSRDDLTPTIDTGHGGFLFFAAPFFVVTWIIIVLLGRFIVLRKATLPTNLWCWDSDRRHRSITFTLLCSFLGGVLTLLIAWSVRAFPWALPSLIVGLYVIASTRAALLGRNRNVTASLID
jgi:hypothetical protein